MGVKMSLKAAKSFIDRMHSDETFRNEIIAIKDPESKIAIIQEKGYKCNADTFTKFYDKINHANSKSFLLNSSTEIDCPYNYGPCGCEACRARVGH